MNLIRRLRQWFAKHPWTVVAFVAGLLVGVLLALPLFSASLPDGTATLLGSAAGAILAVSGAAWVAGTKERAEASALRAAVVLALRDCLGAAEAAISCVDEVKYNELLVGKQSVALIKVRRSAKDAFDRLDALKPGLRTSALSLMQLRQIEEALRQLEEKARDCELAFGDITGPLLGASEEIRLDRFAKAKKGVVGIKRVRQKLRDLQQAIGTRRVVITLS